MILIDSSVWIAAWRGDHPHIINPLSELIESNQASINWLIRTELLQGAKDKRHQREIKRLLEPISLLLFPEEIWDEAASLYLKLREIGLTLTTIDSLIATHSILLKISLWSLDTVFSKMADVESSLKRFQYDQ